jgi:hypothetical protein
MSKKKKSRKVVKKKKNNQKIELKEQDRQKRLKRAKLFTQLDNLIDNYLYEIESNNYLVERSAEKTLIDYIFDPKVVQEIEKSIETGTKNFQDLIIASKELANHTVETMKKNKVETGKTKKVNKEEMNESLRHIQKEKIWPFHL